MKQKYVPQAKKKFGPSNQPGRYVNPEQWITGPDPLTREKYYAWLKHRAQAKYRKEPYHLTWDDWQTLWSDEDFKRRGRKPKDLCLVKTDLDLGWCISNVQVCTRQDQFNRNGEYRKNGRNV